jgi:hypothetical protein
MLSQVFHICKFFLNSSKILVIKSVFAMVLDLAVVLLIVLTEHNMGEDIDNETLQVVV